MKSKSEVIAILKEFRTQQNDWLRGTADYPDLNYYAEKLQPDALTEPEGEGKDWVLNELISIYDYMHKKDAVYGFGQIGDLIQKIQSQPQYCAVCGKLCEDYTSFGFPLCNKHDHNKKSKT